MPITEAQKEKMRKYRAENKESILKTNAIYKRKKYYEDIEKSRQQARDRMRLYYMRKRQQEEEEDNKIISSIGTMDVVSRVGK